MTTEEKLEALKQAIGILRRQLETLTATAERVAGFERGSNLRVAREDLRALIAQQKADRDALGNGGF